MFPSWRFRSVTRLEESLSENFQVKTIAQILSTPQTKTILHLRYPICRCAGLSRWLTCSMIAVSSSWQPPTPTPSNSSSTRRTIKTTAVSMKYSHGTALSRDWQRCSRWSTWWRLRGRFPQKTSSAQGSTYGISVNLQNILSHDLLL